MKVEPRGKFGGVKIHLDPEECETLMKSEDFWHPKDEVEKIIKGMRVLIVKLQKKEPGLLNERTPEQVKAILAKEVEKAKLQLAQVEAGKSHEKVDPAVLKKALLKYVGE